MLSRVNWLDKWEGKTALFNFGEIQNLLFTFLFFNGFQSLVSKVSRVFKVSKVSKVFKVKLQLWAKTKVWIEN